MFADNFLKSMGPEVFTVTELTRRVRGALEKSVGNVWVEGEISNYRKQGSGHQYFVLKDEKCQVSCVLFYQSSARLRNVTLAEGMQVQIRGDLTVYEARGQYQIIVQVVQPAGAGLLQAKFEALKKKLDAEGLFDPARKKILPRFPASIGIVTSPTGAAIRDMLNILQRRAPWMRIVINPARVQGDGAALEIARAVAEFNDDKSLGVDVIVVARGGGSAEDLSQFNEEILARAIFDSALPVVSAVGHEIDFTIADFVADLRAPTPSAAAELIAPDNADLLRHLRACDNAITRNLTAAMDHWRNRLDFAARGALFREPANLIAGAWQSIDLAEKALRFNTESTLAECTEQVKHLLAKLREHRPDQYLEIKRHTLTTLNTRLSQRLGERMQEATHSVKNLQSLLRVLAPESTLQRGFSITTNSAGALIRSAAQAAKGEKIHTRLADGNLDSVVE
ncbi:MAG: exodeoxyribonuclease VII large subunit [Chthoniobacteraceae bacterium]